MRARIIKSLISTTSAARDFLCLVSGGKAKPATPIIEEETPTGASQVLESFRNHRRRGDNEYILTGSRVITAMDEQLRDYRSAGEQFADWVTRGSHVSIPQDDRRFTVIEIWWDDQAIRVRDDEGHDYKIPFTIIRPWPKEPDE